MCPSVWFVCSVLLVSLAVVLIIALSPGSPVHRRNFNFLMIFSTRLSVAKKKKENVINSMVFEINLGYILFLFCLQLMESSTTMPILATNCKPKLMTTRTDAFVCSLVLLANFLRPNISPVRMPIWMKEGTSRCGAATTTWEWANIPESSKPPRKLVWGRTEDCVLYMKRGRGEKDKGGARFC